MVAREGIEVAAGEGIEVVAREGIEVVAAIEEASTVATTGIMGGMAAMITIRAAIGTMGTPIGTIAIITTMTI